MPYCRPIVAFALAALALTAMPVSALAGPATSEPPSALLLGDKGQPAPITTKAGPAADFLLLAAAEAPAQADAPAAPAKPETKPEAGPVVDGATLDSAHTSATFWIRHIVAPVAGRFDAVSGVVAIPPRKPADGRVAFSVKTDSVDTGVAARDKHLRTADFLDPAAYPEMRFESSRIVSAGTRLARVTGKLTIKDVTREVTIPVRLLGTKPHPMLPCVDVTGYEAQFSINRLEYHVGTGKFFKMGAVGDATDIRIAGETLAARPGCVQPAKTGE